MFNIPIPDYFNISSNRFLEAARTVQISDETTREVWERLLTSIETERDSSPALFFNMLESLQETPGALSGFNELSLSTSDEDPNRAELYYLLYANPTVTCPKENLLEAYHQLQKILQAKNG